LRLVTVATYEQPFQAELALALLADAEIPARSAGDHLSGLSTFFSGQRPGIQIQVPEDRADEALALLEATATDRR
jgi:hypothetical protein